MKLYYHIYAWYSLVDICFHVAVVVDQSLSHIQLLWPHGLELSKFLCPWNFPGKNTGVGCHFLFPGIFLTQGSNPRHLRCRWSSSLQADVSLLSHQRSPFIWLQSPEQHLTYPSEIPFWDCHLHFSLNIANTNLTIFPVSRSGLTGTHLWSTGFQTPDPPYFFLI